MPVSTISQAGLDAPISLTNPTLTTPNINSAQIATVSGTAPLYMCRAWVNFNGSTATIRASGNVTSVTRSAAGAYVVNFTNALSDTNYSVTADCSGTSFVRLNTLNTGNIDITTLSTNTVTGQDTTTVCLAIFR